MAFTSKDHINDILIKVLIALASSGEAVSEENRAVILDWIEYLQVEGPELERLLALTRARIDSIQAEIFFNELKATLTRKEDRERIVQILEHFLTHRKKVFKIESALSSQVTGCLNDTSGIEQLFNKRLAAQTESEETDSPDNGSR